MLSIDFEEANHTLEVPIQSFQKEVGDIRVHAGKTSISNKGDAPMTIISKWQPNKEDIEAINRGEGIYLIVFGPIMVPVMLTTDSPF